MALKGIQNINLELDESATICGLYDFVPSVGTFDPGVGNLSLNSAVYTSVTIVTLNQISLAGTDIGQLLSALTTGDIVYIQDQSDITKQVRLSVSAAPTDNGTYWNIPVTHQSSAGALFSNNDNLSICMFLQNGGSGGGGGSQGLQDVITVDPVLTQNNFIDVNGFVLEIGASQGYLQLNSSPTAPYMTAHFQDADTNTYGEIYADRYGTGLYNRDGAMNTNYLELYGDSFNMKMSNWFFNDTLFPSGAGYVLTDLLGDGELTMQPVSGGGGGSDTNFALNNLTADGNRLHNFGAYNLNINNLSGGYSSSLFMQPGNQTGMTVYDSNYDNTIKATTTSNSMSTTYSIGGIDTVGRFTTSVGLAVANALDQAGNVKTNMQLAPNTTFFETTNLVGTPQDLLFHLKQLPENVTGDVVYYDTTSGQLTTGAAPTGGGGADGYTCLHDITHADLLTAIADSTLEIGCYYRITDYQTVHTIAPSTDTHTGNINPIVLRAVDVNKLNAFGDCGLYPGDTIYYEPINDATRFPGATKGFIYRRIDHKLNIDLPIDFKEVVYRRWAVNVTNVWDISTAYAAGDIVVHAGNIYKANYAQTGNTPPAPNTWTSPVKWAWLGYVNGDYVSPLNTVFMYIVPVDAANFQDYPIFNPTGYAAGTFANIISTDIPNKKTDDFYAALNIYDAFNNVFKDFSYFHNIHMSGYYIFTNNTFVGTGDTYNNASKMFHTKISTHASFINNYCWKLDFYDVLLEGEFSITGNHFVDWTVGDSTFSADGYMTGNTTQEGGIFIQNVVQGSTYFTQCYMQTWERCHMFGAYFSGVQEWEMYECNFMHCDMTGGLNKYISHCDIKYVNITSPNTLHTVWDDNVYTEVISRQDGTALVRYIDNTNVQIIAVAYS